MNRYETNYFLQTFLDFNLENTVEMSEKSFFVVSLLIVTSHQFTIHVPQEDIVTINTELEPNKDIFESESLSADTYYTVIWAPSISAVIMIAAVIIVALQRRAVNKLQRDIIHIEMTGRRYLNQENSLDNHKIVAVHADEAIVEYQQNDRRVTRSMMKKNKKFSNTVILDS